MFDIGWTEMLVVAVVAILVVGPKDLPGMLRNIGRAIKKIRGVAADFQQQFNDAIEETGLDDVKSSIDDVRKLNPTQQIKDKLNPLSDTHEPKSDTQNSATDTQDRHDYNPDELFDEEKAPTDPIPVTVDVEQALARQKKLDSTAAEATTKKSAKKKPGIKSKAAAKKMPVSKSAPRKKPTKAKA